MDQRERLLDILLSPYGVTPDEVLADNEVARGLRILDDRSGLRVITAPPLVKNTAYAPFDDETRALERMRFNWMPFLSRTMRTASLRQQRLGAPMRPAWSILVNPVTLMTARATGMPGRRLIRSRLHEGKRVFVPLHENDFEDMPNTIHYVRDGSHHDGADYLHGQFLLNHADHVVKHALQLLEDTRFPVRSVSDANGRETILEIRSLLPETTCGALIGRPLSDLIDLPGLGPGTAGGDLELTEATPNVARGTTEIKLRRCFVPAEDPHDGVDMRWAAMTPQW